MARGGGSRGGGRGGNAKGSAAVPREVTVSKKLSWLLRHGAEKEGLELGRGGYANLADVLKNRNIRSLQPPPTLPEIKELVASNSKQRFSLIHKTAAPAATEPAATEPAASSSSSSSSSAPPPTPPAQQTPEPPADPSTDADPANYLIRANQGHSLQLATGTADLLTPITAAAGNAPRLVVHGSRRDRWAAIVASGGLKPMGRTHVHFATGVPAALATAFARAKAAPAAAVPLEEGTGKGKGKDEEVDEARGVDEGPAVVSGMRASSSLLMYLDLPRAMAAGLQFFASDNGVVLCAGAAGSGVVPLEVFERVEDVKGTALLEDGVVLSRSA